MTIYVTVKHPKTFGVRSEGWYRIITKKDSSNFHLQKQKSASRWETITQHYDLIGALTALTNYITPQKKEEEPMNDGGPKKRYWVGDIDKCDLCGCEIKDSFIDGVTQYGPWGIMCRPCHSRRGCGLGQGKGQRYKKEATTGKYYKIEG